MDPASPNYDRPPQGFNRRQNRRRNLTRVSGPLIRGNNGSDAFVPPKPNPGGRPNVKNLGPGTVKGANQLGLGSGPQKGSLGTVDRFKAAGLKPPKGASQVGFFNATHKHGEPMKNLIAKLKQMRAGKRGKGPSYTPPSGGMSSSR